MESARALGVNAEFAPDQYDAAGGADVLVVVTDWDVFKAPDYGRLKRAMKRSVIVDLRNALSPADARGHGFDYTGVGLEAA